MVIITDYKSGDFHLKGYHIEYLVKFGFISDALETYLNVQMIWWLLFVFDMDSINKNSKCPYCTPHPESVKGSVPAMITCTQKIFLIMKIRHRKKHLCTQSMEWKHCLCIETRKMLFPSHWLLYTEFFSDNAFLLMQK